MKSIGALRFWKRKDPEFQHKSPNRSMAGNIAIFIFLLVCSAFTALPLVYSVSTAFRPLDELWLFPPKLVIVHNPTLKNFSDLFVLMSNSWVPFSRYLFNTIFITVVGTAGHIIFSSMCAYPLAKKIFPGRQIFSQAIVLALMFNASVTAIPNYLTMARFGWIDTYMALIVPAIGSTLGLYLMMQFIGQLPDSILEAATTDGARDWTIFWGVIMPQVKPAWLTIMIFSVQSLWNMGASNYVYSEQLKTLPAALAQIVTGGIARAGVGAAVTVIIMVVPITLFVLTQSNIIQTMTNSGIKE